MFLRDRRRADQRQGPRQAGAAGRAGRPGPRGPGDGRPHRQGTPGRTARRQDDRRPGQADEKEGSVKVGLSMEGNFACLRIEDRSPIEDRKSVV